MASNSDAPISIPSSASNSNSGTKMAYALAGLLPPLFFEAQIRGGRIGGQFGFSMPTTQNQLDIAIFTRSSGAAFAVGISSFVAYKLLHRLIQTNCLFTALEQFSPEKEESKAGEKSVELTEGFYAVRLGGENDLLRRLEDCLSESGSPTNAKNKVAVVQVRQASALKQLFRRNQRIRRAGIAALDQCSSGEEEPLEELAPNRRDILLRYGTGRRGRGEEDEQSTLSGFSNLTSASRIPPNRRHSPSSPTPSILPEQFPECECDTPPSQKSPKMRECRLPSCSSSSTSSSVGTRRSALLHLNCDNELCWENEFSTNSECPTDAEMEFEGEEEGLFLFREREGSLGGISQLSAMKNLEQMFSADWQAEKEEECPNGEYLVETALENLRGMDRLMEANASTSSIMNLIRKKEEEEAQKEPKIMRDSSSFPFTAYRIVVQNSEFDTSEVSSICGSSRSDPYEKHKSHNLDGPCSSSQGLWELTGNGKNSRAKFEKPENANGTECRHLEGMMMLGPGPMFDSVISSHSHSSLASTSAQRSRIGTGNGQQQMATGGGIMYDSAICTDFQSSAEDEDWRENWEQQEQSKEEEGRISRPRAKSGIIRKYGDIDEERPLSKISEQSTPIKRVSTPSIRPPSLQGSEPSLEWF